MRLFHFFVFARQGFDVHTDHGGTLEGFFQVFLSDRPVVGGIFIDYQFQAESFFFIRFRPEGGSLSHDAFVLGSEQPGNDAGRAYYTERYPGIFFQYPEFSPLGGAVDEN